ncbi:MAG: TraB/GumN family protein [Nanoarchaeota archaeon]
MVTINLDNLSIIGTSHISRESINEVRSFILNENPDIIALELDPLRFDALLNPEKKKISLSDIKVVGFKGYLFSIIGSLVQKKLGKIVGVDPGSEMVTAINLALKNKKELCLIDQDIRVTLKRLSQLITFKEKARLFFDLIRSPFVKRIEGIEISRFDLNKVPESEFISVVLKILRQRYPSFHKALIEERNNVIAKNLNRIKAQYSNKKILAVVGAGHLDGLISLLRSG